LPDPTSHAFRDADQPDQFGVTSPQPLSMRRPLPSTGAKPVAASADDSSSTLNQALFRAILPSEVTPQRTQDHSRLPTVLDLREATGSILFQHLLSFFLASSSCHDASVATFRHDAQEGFVGRSRWNA
jgi:hypothetical protein